MRRFTSCAFALAAFAFVLLLSGSAFALEFEVFSEHGDPVPSGLQNYAFSSEVTASVQEMIIVDVNTRIICTGWTGTGSVPATGTENTVSFTIYVNSTLTWNWEYEYTLKVYNPSGVGSPNPPVGIYRYLKGTSLVGSIPNFVGGYVANGFTGTGSAPASSAFPYYSIVINQPTTVTWQWEEAPTSPATQWGTPTAGMTIYGDVKYATVLADPISGINHTIYYEPVQGNLMAAWFNGITWINTVIDSAGDVGVYLKAIVSPAGVYHVAYHDATNGYLKYAISNDGFQWTVQQVDIFNNAGRGLDMVLDANGVPWIAYFAPGLSEVRIANRISGTWEDREVVAYNISGSTHISMDYNALTGEIFVAFQNGQTKRAHYAKVENDAWVVRDIPAQFESGMFIRVAISPFGQPFMTYQELSQSGRRDLILSYVSSGNWYFERLSSIGDSGYYNLLRFDTNGFPVVLTLDRGNSRIRQYSWDGDAWVVVDCASEVAQQPLWITADAEASPVLYYFKSDTIQARKPSTGDGGGSGGGGDVVLGNGGGCFVATAAFGSLSSSSVSTLTALRDNSICAGQTGRTVLSLYYAASPALTTPISGSEAARSLLRRLLD